MRDNPVLSNPMTVAQILETLRVQTSAHRTSLVLRVPVGPSGVALEGQALPDLPGSMVQILSNSRRSGVQQLGSAVVARYPTDWVIQGSDNLRFTVAKNKRVSE